MRRLLIPFVVTFLCAVAIPAFAQQGTSEIGGKVTDDQGGVLPGVTIVLTKFLYEKGSRESKQPKGILPSAVMEILREHSLTIFLVFTGIGWVVIFKAMDATSKWGQVVGNIVSEWTQILGLVLLTKRLMEIGSKE